MEIDNSKKTIINKLISLLIAFVGWIFIGFSGYNNDFPTYERMYQTVNTLGINNYTNLDFGQRLLYRLGGALGLNYSQFLIYYTLVAVIFLWMGLNYLTSNVGITLILYYIFPFMYDVTQVRNFFAMALFIYACHFLFKNEDKKGLIQYIFVMFIASSVHSSFILYFIFLFIKIKSIKKLFIVSLSLMTIMGVSYKLLSHISYSVVAGRMDVYGESGRASLLYACLLYTSPSPRD